MPKVCPVAAQVIAFKNDGAVGLLLGVFILLQLHQELDSPKYYLYLLKAEDTPGQE